MRILISAFSFAPHQGSEPGVGWRWAQELAREHDVVVITDATRRAAAEAELQAAPQPRLRVVYHRPRWLARVPLRAATAQGLYALWQFSLPALARRLHAQQPFDLGLHLTYGVFRHPSLLGGMGFPFVFGPLGGGEDAPRALKASIGGRDRVKEVLRWLLNRAVMLDPVLWWAYARSDLILVKTEQTRAALPWPFRRGAEVFPEIGVDLPPQAPPAQRGPQEPLRLLYAGRLLGWKGVHLALRAVAQARQRGVDAQLSIVGRGPYEAVLHALHTKLGLGEAVRFVPHLPQAELFGLYSSAHALLFPSLHDSSGNVVLEAQAHGCPVVCLDIGGPATLVTPATARVVSSAGADEEQLVTRLADALQWLAQHEPARREMAAAARQHAALQDWPGRAAALLALVATRGLLPGPTGGLVPPSTAAHREP